MDPVQLRWPSNSENLWKANLLDTLFDIVMQSCPPSLVDFEYMTMVREFTMYHLDEVWKITNTNDTELDGTEVAVATSRLAECGSLVDEYHDTLHRV
jgi:hypothetical protein